MTARSTFLRLLVAGLAILVAVAAVVVGVRAVEAAWGLDPAVASATRRVGVVLAALGAYRASCRWSEGRQTPELSVSPAAIAAGGLAGVAWIAVPLAIVYAAGGYEVTAVRGVMPALGGTFVVIVVAAFLEELVFRAVLFRILEAWAGTTTAMALSVVAFALAHLGNSDGVVTPAEDVMGVVSSLVVGALWTLVYAWSRNLWVVTANHALWNFTIILTGLTLSGIDDWRMLGPVASRYAGPMWLTGGAFGPESSAVTLVWVAGWIAVLWRRSHRDPSVDSVSPVLT